jgi:hypothetical protein
MLLAGASTDRNSLRNFLSIVKCASPSHSVPSVVVAFTCQCPLILFLIFVKPSLFLFEAILFVRNKTQIQTNTATKYKISTVVTRFSVNVPSEQWSWNENCHHLPSSKLPQSKETAAATVKPTAKIREANPINIGSGVVLITALTASIPLSSDITTPAVRCVSLTTNKLGTRRSRVHGGWKASHCVCRNHQFRTKNRPLIFKSFFLARFRCKSDRNSPQFSRWQPMSQADSSTAAAKFGMRVSYIGADCR